MQHGAFTAKFTTLRFIPVSLESLIQGLFCAAAGMISFGAVLGKASPAQVVLLLLLEVPLYAVNAEVLVGGIFDKMGAQARAFQAAMLMSPGLARMRRRTHAYCRGRRMVGSQANAPCHARDLKVPQAGYPGALCYVGIACA